MPYRIEKREGKRPYKIIKETTGKIVGSSVSITMAKKALKARYAHEKRK